MSHSIFFSHFQVSKLLSFLLFHGFSPSDFHFFNGLHLIFHLIFIWYFHIFPFFHVRFPFFWMGPAQGSQLHGTGACRPCAWLGHPAAISGAWWENKGIVQRGLTMFNLQNRVKSKSEWDAIPGYLWQIMGYCTYDCWKFWSIAI